MRRSFGGGSRGMGGGSGGGGGGGGMLRTVHRAVRAGVSGGTTHEPFSHATNTTNTIKTTQTCKKKSNTTSNNTITLSSSTSSSNSSPFSSHNIPISAASSAPAWPTVSSPPYSVCDDSEWEQVDGNEDERGHAYFDDLVFGTVPSRDEVQHAVCSLQQVFEPTSYSFIKDTVAYHSDKEVGDQVCGPTGCVHTVSAVGTDSDWIEPSAHLCDSKGLKPYGADRVYDAFHLLNTEPSVQRMVISLSSDKAIWNAVLNNEAVREFRESLNQGPADTNFPENRDEGSDDSAKDILSSILVKIKEKVIELVDKIMKLVNEVFQPPEKTSAGTVDPLEEKLRASFLLSVVVLLIVVVTRANQA